ncbi:MAG: glycosyltransferase [Anaerolineae bacterium]|nr:glycosyltransferase [Anaerolineae bacterium]MDW8070813.1 glycosyltransferase family 2 protein [Anaerolineae bacterium]
MSVDCSSDLLTPATDAPTVSIVIINWNGQEHLARCLASLEAQTYRDFEIIVVDNGSTDGSVGFIRERYPAVRLIRNERNMGFARANNQGIAMARGRYIAILNNDTQAEPPWLETLVSAAEAHPEMGAFAPLVLFNDRRDTIDSAGLTVLIWGYGVQNRLGEHRARAGSICEVFGVTATAALFRRELLLDIGLFDEDYFIYYEDVDLAWRARLRGWRALFVPEAIVYHTHSATVGRNSPFKRRLLTRNRLWTIVKNYHFPAFLFFLPLIVILQIGSVVLSLVRGDTAPLTGLWQGLMGLPGALRKRAIVQSRRTASFREMVSWMGWFQSPFPTWRLRWALGRL